MRSSILVLGLVVGEVVAGCGFHSPAGAAADGGAAGGDRGIDGTAAAPRLATLVDTCQLSFDADLTIVPGPASYNTDTPVLTIGGTTMPFALKTVMIGSDPIDVISAHDVHLGLSAVLPRHRLARARDHREQRRRPSTPTRRSTSATAGRRADLVLERRDQGS